MSNRTYILAAFFGLLVGGGVWFWPQAPMWVSEAGAERICGFSLDRRILITSSGLSSVREDQHVARWDADTGRLLSRAVMACDQLKDPRDFRAIRPSPDAAIALVAQGVPFADYPGMLELFTGQWFLHDAITGKRLLGPIKGVNYVGHLAFSLDGRWFAGYRGDPTSGVRAYHALGIYSAETGDCVAEASTESGGLATCWFAPDGKSAAVCLTPKADQAGDHLTVVRLHELPSGRPLRQAEIRYPTRLFVHGWDGRHLALIDALPEVPQCIVFDFSEHAVPHGVPDPVIRSHVNAAGQKVYVHWQVGSDWAAFVVDLAPKARRTGITGWLDRLTERIEGKREGRNSEVRVVDRVTGATRYELPRMVARNLVFSADGKRLACPTGRDNSFEVWNLDPPPRWPYALAWGIAAAGLVLAIAKWRRCRAIA